MNNQRYILDANKVPVVEPDLIKWAHWFENAYRTRECVVVQERFGCIMLSTIFLALDFSFGLGPPLLFETQILGGRHGGRFQDRCGGTWEDARAMHVAAKHWMWHHRKGAPRSRRKIINAQKAQGIRPSTLNKHSLLTLQALYS